MSAAPVAGEVPVAVGALLTAGCARLPGPDARIDAELLLAHVLGCSRTRLFAYPEAGVDAASRARYLALLERRRAGEPVAYLLGRQAFWSLDIALDGNTLVPRPETELLVELALVRGAARAADVLDLGTGSGAIALALAIERPAWRVLGVDRDPAAVHLARRNAGRLGLGNVAFETGDWFAGLEGRRFDLVVANPPYIAEDDPCLAAPGVCREPRHALVAGTDGLDALRRIVVAAPQHLSSDGWLLCEHGAAQGDALRALFAAAGLVAIATQRDLAGHERVTLGRIGESHHERSHAP